MTFSPHKDMTDGARRAIRTLYIVMVLYSVVTLTINTQSIEQGHQNCLNAKTSAVKANAALDYFAQSAAVKVILTPAQQKERAQKLADFHTYVPKHCPGIWPFQ